MTTEKETAESGGTGAKPRYKEITVLVEGVEYSFHVTKEAHRTLQRESQRSVPMAVENFLLDTSTDRARLRAEFEVDWTLPNLLLTPIAEKMGGAREATIKK